MVVLDLEVALKCSRLKIGRQVDLLHERFNDLSNPEVNDTFTSYNFGFPMIITKDPENIKALLATQFNDFSLGRRYDFFKPLLGKDFHIGW